MIARQLVVFCDLDGTLVLDNSFHVFLASAWSLSGAGGRLNLFARVAPRALGRVGGGHAGMKRRALDWYWQQEPPLRQAIVERTVRRLSYTLSQPVISLLRDTARQGARIVLATAAPDVYTGHMQVLVGAESCLATPGRPGPGWQELLGEAKARACQTWLKDNTNSDGGHDVIVVTDHPDDLPLLRLADKAVLQGSPRVLDMLEGAIRAQPDGARTEVARIDVLSAQAPGGGYWLWFDDRPEGPLDYWELKTILSKHRHAHLYAGDGRWQWIGPAQPFSAAVRRRDCPSPPSSRMRLAIHFRRRLLRDWLGIYH
ncbi:haloacid dehalogenase-like hydrolase [Yoonia vestfoldensis]|uniref:Uncharacterized protein n=1 Tax=Yoonia vestfoldensis SKA53 TaxID=314232 RepID=A3V6A0_9RHOB|nr:haloacid dehalogenase-like hydrolase [Yoonia vestfoldensis]EAQ06424.1 hypothetical protein SKA53_05033 [Yoonia vestfoldensis SKA53]